MGKRERKRGRARQQQVVAVTKRPAGPMTARRVFAEIEKRSQIVKGPGDAGA
jgi:hypothetical protein